MTKEELVEHLVKDCEQPRDVVTDLLLSFGDAVAAALGRGEPLFMPGLGRLIPRLTFRKSAGGKRAPYITGYWSLEPELAARLAALALQVKATGTIPDGVATPLRHWLYQGMGWELEGAKRNHPSRKASGGLPPLAGKTAAGGKGQRAKRKGRKGRT